MQPYPTIQNYLPYPSIHQPYPDRLAQLQNQYQQAVNVPQMVPTSMSGATPQVNQGLLWVQGEAGAKSYLVAPNTTVLLMDSEASRFYLKSTDGAGMPNLRTFEYTEVSQNAPQALNSRDFNFDDKYVTRDEYEALKSQYEDITEKLNSIQNANKPVKKAKEVTENE